MTVVAGVMIRPLRPADRERYVTAVTGLSAQTWLQRFLGPKRDLTEAEIMAFLDVGHDGRESVAAIEEATGAIVGVGRFAPTSTDLARAEIALVISDDWQHHGVGGALLDRLLELAADHGYRSVAAMSMITNRAVTHMLRARGFMTGRAQDGVVWWERQLDSAGRDVLA